MGRPESKEYQLRVRISNEERDQLDRLRGERGRGETVSDLVREAIGQLTQPAESRGVPPLRSDLRQRIERLAELLQRQPRQVEESCIEGIIDLIERKCELPLIVMETQLHMKYRGMTEMSELEWPNRPDVPPAEIPRPPVS
jgi:Arc/MetJ-type ribon-helix-helix transcriptional regulator